MSLLSGIRPPPAAHEATHPSLPGLPDPLVCLDGTPITTPLMWESRRRGEILELFRQHVYGRNPIERPASLSVHTLADSEASVFGGAGMRRQYRIVYATPGRGAGDFLISVYTPADTETAKGIFVFINNRESLHAEDAERNDFFAKDIVVQRGYVAIGFHHLEIAPEDDVLNEGVFRVYGPNVATATDRGPEDWGSVGAWAWGASRVIDWIKDEPSFCDLPVAVVGHSRGGKAALWCGAQDLRVDLVVSNNSGCAGAALTRSKGGERVAQIVERFPQWFSERYREYAGNEAAMPVDQHMLLALMAPRPVYIASAQDDAWADPAAEFSSALLASRVYELCRQPGLAATDFPVANAPIHRGLIGYHLRGEPHGTKHDLTRYDWTQFLDFADAVWKRPHELK